ncbi:hypothetical protein VTO42DRAFT_6318 [Malbranchea cinnamomea]
MGSAWAFPIGRKKKEKKKGGGGRGLTALGNVVRASISAWKSLVSSRSGAQTPPRASACLGLLHGWDGGLDGVSIECPTGTPFCPCAAAPKYRLPYGGYDDHEYHVVSQASTRTVTADAPQLARVKKNERNGVQYERGPPGRPSLSRILCITFVS